MAAKTPADVFIALGGNQGDVLATFRWALDAMRASGVLPKAVSAAYRTRALLPPGEQGPAPDYWNAVLWASTELSAEALIERLHDIEAAAGRVRHKPWQARPLDLDLLIYDDLIATSPHLTVPHPRLGERPFVLQPLADVAAQREVPGLGARVADLLRRLPDPHRGILERRPTW